jgi:uncharacterized protein involved in exopolysaccharide biosynthesis
MVNETNGQEAAMAREWEERSSSMRDFLTIVFKRRRLILAFFLTTVVVTALATFLSHPTYEATAAILVKKSSVEMPLVPKESSQLIISQVTEEDLNSETVILKSRQAIEDTLHSLGVDESWRHEGPLQRARSQVAAFLGAPRLSYFDEMVLGLEKEIEVSPIRKSNVLKISYRHTDPEWAMQVVRGLTERYITRRAEVYQSPQAVSFFEEEMRAAEARLKKAEQALEAYSKEAGVSVLGLGGDSQSLAAEKEATLGRLAEFERQYGEAAVQVRQQTERVAALEAQLAREPERLPSSQRFNQDPTTEELERALVALQLKRDALVQDFTPENRQVRDVEDQIRATQERLKVAESRVASINRTELNTVYQNLRAQLLIARADLKGVRARNDSLQNQMASYRQQLEELSRKGLTTDELRREARAAEDAYMLYQKKHEEARISAAMDQQRIVNVSIAQPAQRPLRPVAPNKRKNLVLGLLLGAFGGLGLAFATEYFDHSFTTGRELEARLGIPLLGTIPEHESIGRTS